MFTSTKHPGPQRALHHQPGGKHHNDKEERGYQEVKEACDVDPDPQIPRSPDPSRCFITSVLPLWHQQLGVVIGVTTHL